MQPRLPHAGSRRPAWCRRVSSGAKGRLAGRAGRVRPRTASGPTCRCTTPSLLAVLAALLRFSEFSANAAYHFAA